MMSLVREFIIVLLLRFLSKKFELLILFSIGSRQGLNLLCLFATLLLKYTTGLIQALELSHGREAINAKSLVGFR